MAITMARPGRYPITAMFTWLLVVFLVLFPKGGIKFGFVPLTWGYAVLGVTLVPATLIRFLAMPLRFHVATLVAFASTIPFLIVFGYSCVANGILFAGAAVSDLVCFLVLPFAFLIVYPAFFPRIDGERLSRLLRFCILATAVIGFFLFVWYRVTQHLIEVPYLTVNAGDYGETAYTKHNSRGLFLKLASTYNNGNLYGTALLMLLPMYDRLEPKLWKRNTVKLALLLTLSRTVWFGLILEQGLSLLKLALDAARTFPRIVPGPALRRALLIGATFVLVLVALTLTSGTLAFLFDRGLGGRISSLEGLNQSTWLPGLSINLFVEILYASALNEYGVIGMLSILLLFVAVPVLLFFRDPDAILRSPLRLAAFKGLLIYMIVAGIDSALNYIPIMAFYWFVYSIFLEGWPGVSPAVAAVQQRFIPTPMLAQAEPGT